MKDKIYQARLLLSTILLIILVSRHEYRTHSVQLWVFHRRWMGSQLVLAVRSCAGGGWGFVLKVFRLCWGWVRSCCRCVKSCAEGGQATAKIHWDKLVSDEFPINRGDRQGDPLSPKLFTAVMDEVLTKADISEGINVNGEHLANLRFAYDVVLFNEKNKTNGKKPI